MADAYCEINGAPVFQATIAFPRFGIWHADLAVADGTAPVGAVTLTFATGAISWKGFAYRGGAPFETATVRVVGGAGGLATGMQLPAQAYGACPLQIPLNDILNAAGEKLSPNADPTVLNAPLQAWTRGIGPAGTAIASLMTAVGASWRAMPDGTIWVGHETWPTSTVTTPTLLTDEPMHGQQDIYDDLPNVLPGTVLNGRQISYVQQIVREDHLRTEVLYEDAATGIFDRVKGPLAAFVRAVQPTLYLGSFSGKIVAQNGMRVDFVPDDPRIPGQKNVQLRLGEPYTTVVLKLPCRATLTFDNFNQQGPAVSLFDPGGQFTSMSIAGGTQGAARVGDSISATLTLTELGSFVFTAPPGGGACVVTGGAQTLSGQITSGSSKVTVG
jgi:hypothetical protein